LIWDTPTIVTGKPYFANRNGPDGVPNTADDDLRLQWLSPCMDAGSNGVVATNEDLAGLPRILAGGSGPAVVDIGAYEYRLVDCNTNGNPDDLDIAFMLSSDANTNGVPDECVPVLDYGVIRQAHADADFDVSAGECDPRPLAGAAIVLGFAAPTFSTDGDALDVDDFTVVSSCVQGVVFLYEVTTTDSETYFLSYILQAGWNWVTDDCLLTVEFDAETAAGDEGSYALCWTHVTGDTNQDGTVTVPPNGDEDTQWCEDEDGNSVSAGNFLCDLDRDGQIEWASPADDDAVITYGNQGDAAPAACD
jgi:hypothetical protein